MTGTTDPRERLVTLGNQIVEAAYQLYVENDRYLELKRALGDHERLGRLMEAGGAEFMVRWLTLTSERDAALREYTAVRQTIEAMSKGSD